MKGGGPPWQSVVVDGSSPKSTWIWTPFPEHVRVALAEVASAAREGVLALSVACGLQVIAEMMAADVDRICGPKGKHDADRAAYRHGAEARQVPLGSALVDTERPRARTTEGREVRLPTWEVYSRRDLLHEIALGRMLAGLSARRYRAGSEPVGEVEPHGASRSAISRRFRRATQAKLAELFGRDRSELRLLAVFIDGIHVGGHEIVVALGVDEQGRKHPLGLWEGTTENKATCSALIDNLIDRGLPEDRALLFVIDGGKAIRRAIASHWGELALVQRCHQHKQTNVTDHLPHAERTFVARKLRAAWSNRDPDAAERELRALARALESKHPGRAVAGRGQGLGGALRRGRRGGLLGSCRRGGHGGPAAARGRGRARASRRGQGGRLPEGRSRGAGPVASRHRRGRRPGAAGRRRQGAPVRGRLPVQQLHRAPEGVGDRGDRPQGPADVQAGSSLLRTQLLRSADVAGTIDPQLAQIYCTQMVERGANHLKALGVVASHLAERAWAVLARGTPYELRDTDGRPVSRSEAKAIIAERWTVPEEVRPRRRSKKVGKVPHQVLAGHVSRARSAVPRRPSPQAIVDAASRAVKPTRGGA